MAYELIGAGNPDACGAFVDPRLRGGDISVGGYVRVVPVALNL